MTDKELTRIIAEQVLGWELESTPWGLGYWHKGNGCVMTVENFQPLYKDDCCMMAWDKFTDAIRDAERDEPGDFEDATYYIFTQHSTYERRKAICEYIVKAIGHLQPDKATSLTGDM